MEKGTYEKSIPISIGIQGNLPGNQRYLAGNKFRNSHVGSFTGAKGISPWNFKTRSSWLQIEKNSNNVFFLKEKIIHPPFTSVRPALIADGEIGWAVIRYSFLSDHQFEKTSSFDHWWHSQFVIYTLVKYK